MTRTICHVRISKRLAGLQHLAKSDMFITLLYLGNRGGILHKGVRKCVKVSASDHRPQMSIF